jgi:hypothetical protein
VTYAKKIVVFEISEREIRAFKALLPLSGKVRRGHHSVSVEFDTIPISGVIEQGVVCDEASLLQSLVDYRSKDIYKGYLAYLAIPMHSGFVRSYKLPWLSRRNRESSIALLVAEEVPGKADVLYDYLVLEEEKYKSLTILLAASRQGILNQYVSIFEKAGFRIGGVNFTFAVLGQGLELDSDEDVLYLQGEFDRLQIVLFRGVVPQSIRTLHLTDGSLVSLLQEEGENKQSIGLHFEEWENEIQRVILYFRTQYPTLNLRRIIWSGGSVLEFLVKKILAVNSVLDINQARLESVPDLWSKVLQGHQGRSEAVIAYGIKIYTNSSVLNLWRQPIKLQNKQRRYQRLVFGLGVLLLSGNFTWLFMHLKTAALQQEVGRLSYKGIRIQAQLKRQMDLEREWKIAQTTFAETGSSLGHVLMLPGSELNIKKLVYKQGNMSITGNSKNANSIQLLIKGLHSLGWSYPSLTGYKSNSPGYIEFSLSTKRDVRK